MAGGLPCEVKAEAFWQAYLTSLPQAQDASSRFYEVFQIGKSPEAADEGAALITQGVKTATSSLLWEYQATNKPLPAVGSLSIVTDGRGAPVCVVETLTVEMKSFADVDAAFAYDYGEWDRTLETWRAQCWAFNTLRCQAIGKTPTPEMPLVCEWFRVVYPSSAACPTGARCVPMVPPMIASPPYCLEIVRFLRPWPTLTTRSDCIMGFGLLTDGRVRDIRFSSSWRPAIITGEKVRQYHR